MMKCKICLIYASIVIGALMLIVSIGIIVAGDLHTRIENKLKGVSSYIHFTKHTCIFFVTFFLRLCTSVILAEMFAVLSCGFNDK